jgi:hypothetical protein
MEGLIFSYLVDFIFILTEFESLDMNYPFIFEGYDDNGVFICI